MTVSSSYLAAERTARQAAEQEAARKGQDLDKRTTEAVGAHRAAVRERFDRMAREHEAVVSGISQAKFMLDQARSDLKAAHAAGDTDRIADLTEHIGRVAGQLSQLEATKPNVDAHLHEAKATYEDTERYVAEAARKKADAPVSVAEQPKGPKDFRDFADNYADQWIDQSPRAAQSWLREHKSAVMSDPTKFEQLNAFARLYALLSLEASASALHPLSLREPFLVQADRRQLERCAGLSMWRGACIFGAS